jgi:V/A-type H+/Na+-transporting ATPase subunit I
MEREGNAHVVIVGPRDEGQSELNSLLSSAGFTAIPLPQGLDDAPETIQADQRSERDRIERERADLHEEVETCATEMHDKLVRASTVLALAEPFVSLDPAIRGVGYLASIDGWVPAEALPDLERRLDASLQNPFSLESRKPREDERPLVPTVPVRNRWLQPFALLVKQYGIPAMARSTPPCCSPSPSC